jgi:ATP adenylyltransferase
MDRLWSPWRYRYVASAGGGDDRCVFCDKARGGDDRADLVLHRATSNYALLNLFPYTNGHLMIAPYRHVASLEEADEETVAEMMLLARRATALLRSSYGAPGANVGINIGACAGAGVAGHLHLHVLPRWPGDANFMTTVGETRVMPEELGDTWERLRLGW